MSVVFQRYPVLIQVMLERKLEQNYQSLQKKCGVYSLGAVSFSSKKFSKQTSLNTRIFLLTYSQNIFVSFAPIASNLLYKLS